MARLRAIPWFVLLQALMALREEWSRLPQADRAKLASIVAEARSTRSLSPRDRQELRRIAASIDKGALARAVVAARGRGHGRGLRRF